MRKKERSDSSATTYSYQRIARSLLAMMDSGALVAGDRLPSVRQLCRTERVSPATAAQAYADLEREGRIAARERSGHYVLPFTRTNLQPVMTPPDPEPTRVGVSDAVEAIFKSAANRRLVPLAATIPDPALLPERELSRYLKATATDDPGRLTRYSFEPALPDFARELARRYAAAGCVIPPEEFTITAGGMESLNLAIRAVTRPGEIVAVESPGYFGLLEILESLGLKALPIPTSCEEGMDLAAMKAALDDFPVKALVLVSAFSNPTGATLPDAKRAQLVELLEDYGVPLVEDDIYGELAFDNSRPRPVRAWDRRGGVLLCGSLSKSLCPGLRLGWVAGGAFTERVRRLKHISSVNTPVVAQAALAAYLGDNRFDCHLRRLRRSFQQQVWNTRQAVLAHFPSGTASSDPKGGYCLWVQLPGAIDSNVLASEALKRGIGVAPGSIFCPLGNYRNFLRLGCGVVWSAEVEQAIATLGALAHSQSRRSLRVRGRGKLAKVA